MPARRRKPASIKAVAVRTHEATGSSPDGWEAAVLSAVEDARRAVGAEPIGFDVIRFAGDLSEDGVRAYRATVKVAYRQRLAPPKPPKAK